jgi:hypothetical protein
MEDGRPGNVIGGIESVAGRVQERLREGPPAHGDPCLINPYGLILALLVKRSYRFDIDLPVRHLQSRARCFKCLQDGRRELVGNGRHCVRFPAENEDGRHHQQQRQP